MNLLLHPGYFLNIANFAAIAQNTITWEVEDNYQKQTYRNRCFVATDNGKHLLSIPIQHLGKNQGKQKHKEVKIDNFYQWQRQHWRTIETAYRSSPFFEFYEDEILPLYQKEHNFLLDFNLQTIETICNCLQIKFPKTKTTVFNKNPENTIEGRFLINAKNNNHIQEQEKYVQVFNDRYNFIPNLSILDLLFSEGTNTLPYLKNINLSTNA